MPPPAVPLTGVERPFADDEIIVSKTDLSGRITYVNDVFVRVAAYTRAELMGQAHSIIRHPAMPRCVFQLLWDTIEAKREVFAYVINRAKNGDHYWVFAHVTPTLDARGELVGYHSNRRTVDRRVLPEVEALYARLCAAERGHRRKRDAIAASTALFEEALSRRTQTYEEYVWSL
jgi:PAS domain S-box-containing protein